MNKKYYNFPKGKVNEGEAGVACATREIWEEIGIDISKLIKDDCVIEYNVKKESKTMYVVVGVNENYKFNPNHRTRNEIGTIKWLSLKEYERRKNEEKFCLIKHFLDPIKMFIQTYSKKMNLNNISEKNQEAKTSGNKIDEILNRSNSGEDVKDEVFFDKEGIHLRDHKTNHAKKLDSSELASCPENSIGEEDQKSSPLQTDDLMGRLEKRVQVFAEELEKKMVTFTARLALDPNSLPYMPMNNPFKVPFSLRDV